VKTNEETRSGKAGRRYDEEFKRNAVLMLESGDRTAVQLAEELGVSDRSLGKWKRQYGKGATSRTALPKSVGADQRARIRELERELETVSRQRDILSLMLSTAAEAPQLDN
jgi:transposase-like protein